MQNKTNSYNYHSIGTHDDDDIMLVFLNPLLGIFQNFCELVFSGARSRGVHVLPLSLERERHQDGLVPGPGGVETELSSSIIDQVELRIVASPDELPAPLLGAVLPGLVPLDEREVGGDDCPPTGLHKLKTLLGLSRGADGVEVVKEDASDAS